MTDTEKEIDKMIKHVVYEVACFGSAVGSWYTNNVPWHQRAGRGCMEAIRDAAAFEIKSEIASITENLCHQCGQQPKPRKSQGDQS